MHSDERTAPLKAVRRIGEDKLSYDTPELVILEKSRKVKLKII